MPNGFIDSVLHDDLRRVRGKPAIYEEVEDDYLLFLINYNTETAQADIEVALEAIGSYVLRELITEEKKPVDADGLRL